MKFIQFLFCAIFFQSCIAQPVQKIKSNTDSNTLLWEITGKDLSKPSYLFGTFHLMCREDIRFSNELKKALGSVSEVYFEMDLDDPSNTLGGLLFMNMKDGMSLKDLYSTEEYNRLELFFKDSLRMPLATMKRMKPSVIEAVLYPKLMPCKNLSGVEMELMKLAQQDKKEIRGFETIADQAAVFDSVPLDKQAKALMNTIDSFNIYQKTFDSLLLVYKNQQMPEIEKMMSRTESGLGESRYIMLDKRNINWVAQLKKIMDKKNIFIAVGAGHLVGENGVIDLLKKEGYILRPLLNK